MAQRTSGKVSRSAFWQRHVRAWTKSGETASAYASQHGLAVQSLYQAKHREKVKGAKADPAPAAFARVAVLSPRESPGRTVPALRVTLPSGIILEWESAPSMSEIAGLIAQEPGSR